MKRLAQIAAFVFAVLLILSAFLTLRAEAAGDYWIVKAPMLTPRDSLGVATVNGKLYAIGGNALYANGSYKRTNANEEYDPAKNTWTTKKPMPTARAGFAIAVWQNKIYCIGGLTGAYSITGANEVYDPATNTWETKASMPTPRYYLDANVVNGKIYLIGGNWGFIPGGGNMSISNLNEVYDPATDTWTTKASIPPAVESYASAVVDNKIYVIYFSLNQIYDAETDTWTLGAPSPHPEGNAAAGATTGVWAPKRIYVIGGGIMSRVTSRTSVYNPEDDSWTVGAEMPTARYALAVAVVRDRLYAIGGAPAWFSTHTYVANEEYTPIGYGTLPPAISIVSPENKTYTTNKVPLTFTVSEPTAWMGYSLDGQANVTITGNTTLTGLSDGSHSLTVYARGSAGKIGTSETIYFSIKTEPFPTTWVAAATAIIAIGGALLAYFVKIKKTTKKAEK